MSAPPSAVALPDEANIGTLQLTRLIAEALLPSLENCEGLACVMGMKKSTQSGVFPFKLTIADRKALEPLFAVLPKVRAGMTEDEQQCFMSAYRALPTKPEGEPYFASQFDIDGRRIAIQNLDSTHQDSLRQKVKAGEIQVYDLAHRPADSLGMNVFISRSEAIKYLQAINLTWKSLPDFSSELIDTPTIVRHTLDKDAPHIPEGTRAIGRIAMKAAWQIQNETGRPASFHATFNRLIDWYKENSSFAEGVIVGYDEKEEALMWAVEHSLKGKAYKMEACRRHVELWQANYERFTEK